MDPSPPDTFLLRRISGADERRPGPQSRPGGNPVTGPYAAAPGNPLPPAPVSSPSRRPRPRRG
jgi:hypothetical protein